MSTFGHPINSLKYNAKSPGTQCEEVRTEPRKPKRFSSTKILTTRRQALLGTGAVIIGTGIGRPASAFWGAWWLAFSAAAAAGWLVEALKNWGLVPEAHAATSVQAPHEREVQPLQQQGYAISPLYGGAYSGGDFQLSEASRGDEFLALSTTSHQLPEGNKVCTNRLDQADAAALANVSAALRIKGFDPASVQAATLPIHPPGTNRFVDGRRYSPTYMTPAHGTINWSTDASNPHPNLVTSIRSGIIDADIRFARMDSGRWIFDLQNV